MIKLKKKALRPRIKARIRKGKIVLKKKFLATRTKARIRKSKIGINTQVKNFFEWIKGS